MNNFKRTVILSGDAAAIADAVDNMSQASRIMVVSSVQANETTLSIISTDPDPERIGQLMGLLDWPGIVVVDTGETEG